MANCIEIPLANREIAFNILPRDQYMKLSILLIRGR